MRGLRVLELGGSIAAAYCARLFVATRADVVLVEPATGAPTRARRPVIDGADGTARSAFHEYLDAGKRSVVLDVDGPDGDAALAWADLVILTVDGDPDRATALGERI